MTIIQILREYPIYVNVLKYLSRCDCVLLSRTNKKIYNIMINFGFLVVIDFNRQNISKHNINIHIRTLKYINFYKYKNVFTGLPRLNKNIEIRIRDCNCLGFQDFLHYDSIYKLIILGEHNLDIINLNKLVNLEYLGIEYIKQNSIIYLKNLKSLKIYGNININKINCPLLNNLFYYVTGDNQISFIDLYHFKKLDHISLFLSLYTNIKTIKVHKNIRKINIFVNNIVYEKYFNTDDDNLYTKFRKIKNIIDKDDYYIIKPVISQFDNIYYY